jgi:hypothetical protein
MVGGFEMAGLRRCTRDEVEPRAFRTSRSHYVFGPCFNGRGSHNQPLNYPFTDNPCAETIELASRKSIRLSYTGVVASCTSCLPRRLLVSSTAPGQIRATRLDDSPTRSRDLASICKHFLEHGRSMVPLTLIDSALMWAEDGKCGSTIFRVLWSIARASHELAGLIASTNLAFTPLNSLSCISFLIIGCALCSSNAARPVYRSKK